MDMQQGTVIGKSTGCATALRRLSCCPLQAKHSCRHSWRARDALCSRDVGECWEGHPALGPLESMSLCPATQRRKQGRSGGAGACGGLKQPSAITVESRECECSEGREESTGGYQPVLNMHGCQQRCNAHIAEHIHGKQHLVRFCKFLLYEEENKAQPII